MINSRDKSVETELDPRKMEEFIDLDGKIIMVTPKEKAERYIGIMVAKGYEKRDLTIFFPQFKRYVIAEVMSYPIKIGEMISYCEKVKKELEGRSHPVTILQKMSERDTIEISPESITIDSRAGKVVIPIIRAMPSKIENVEKAIIADKAIYTQVNITDTMVSPFSSPKMLLQLPPMETPEWLRIGSSITQSQAREIAYEKAEQPEFGIGIETVVVQNLKEEKPVVGKDSAGEEKITTENKECVEKRTIVPSINISSESSFYALRRSVREKYITFPQLEIPTYGHQMFTTTREMEQLMAFTLDIKLIAERLGLSRIAIKEVRSYVSYDLINSLLENDLEVRMMSNQQLSQMCRKNEGDFFIEDSKELFLNTTELARISEMFYASRKAVPFDAQERKQILNRMLQELGNYPQLFLLPYFSDLSRFSKNIYPTSLSHEPLVWFCTVPCFPEFTCEQFFHRTSQAVYNKLSFPLLRQRYIDRDPFANPLYNTTFRLCSRRSPEGIILDTKMKEGHRRLCGMNRGKVYKLDRNDYVNGITEDHQLATVIENIFNSYVESMRKDN